MDKNSQIIPASGRKKVLPIVANVIQYFNADGNFLGNRFNVFQIYNDGSATLFVGSDPNIGASGENSLATVVAGGAIVLSIVGGQDTLYLRSGANGSARIFYFYESNLTSNQLYQNLATVIINSGLATSVQVTAELPAGTQTIGKVGLVAGTAAVGTVGVTALPALAAGTNLVGSVKVTDGVTVAAVDTEAGAVVTIDQNHHEVHAGGAYSVGQANASLANNGTFLFEIITGAVTPHMKAARAFTGGTSGKLEIIEAPTITDGNAALVPVNRRRTGTPPTSGVTIYSNPTSISAGTILTEYYFTGKAEFVADQLELILKAGTKYLYRFTNTSGGAAVCSMELFWYE
jgi:hypothetical protein